MRCKLSTIFHIFYYLGANYQHETQAKCAIYESLEMLGDGDDVPLHKMSYGYTKGQSATYT